MKKLTITEIWIIGLAIFSMLFGAGNIMLAINVGMRAGLHFSWANFAFLLSAVVMPIAGLVGVILFNGNYNKFFNRLGTIPGQLLVFLIMLIIGPLNVIPRIITLSYTMLEQFLPSNSLAYFSIAFLAITFLATFKESKVIGLLGKFISPILIVALTTIIGFGIFKSGSIIPTDSSIWEIFWRESKYGFVTFDLLGTIFFGSIVINLLKENRTEQLDNKSTLLAALYGGLVGSGILGLIYMGLAWIGNKHSYGLICGNEGELLREISLRILGPWGLMFMAVAVLMACFSTAIALMVVVSEYIQKNIFQSKISYTTSLIIVHVASYFPSTMGLSTALRLSIGPVASIIYPIVMMVTACNLAYKFWNFKPIKTLTLATAIGSTVLYLAW